MEAMSGDIAPVLEECLYFLDVSMTALQSRLYAQTDGRWTLQNLDTLAKDEKVKPRMQMNAMEELVIRKEPLGAVLIIGEQQIEHVRAIQGF